MRDRKNYKLGIFSWFGFQLPIKDRLMLIKQAGFQATTLWWEDEALFLKEKKEILPEMTRDLGLYIENIHVPFEDCNDIWSSDSRTRNEMIKTYLSWVEDCAKFQIPIMVMHVSKGIDLESPNKYGIESIARILRLAEELGVIIAVENTRRLDYFDFVLKEFTSSNLGYCYDSSHDWLHSKEKTEILRKWEKRLISLHLSDNDGLDDKHWLPGHGIVDWQRIAGDLPDTVGSGCLTLEVYPTEDEKHEKPGAFLDKAYQKISWFQGLLK